MVCFGLIQIKKMLLLERYNLKKNTERKATCCEEIFSIQIFEKYFSPKYELYIKRKNGQRI